MIVVSIKEEKIMNKKVVATINFSEYKDVLFNKCLRYLSKIQSENHKIGTSEIS